MSFELETYTNSKLIIKTHNWVGVEVDRYICIHGHFYQPPRENPWLEAIELQDSAAPYHDWNARITAECYAPNGAARILDGEGRIRAIVNNYAHISFNLRAAADDPLGVRVAAAGGDDAARQWMAHLSVLGEQLGVSGEA
jgi:hypothetical protein